MLRQLRSSTVVEAIRRPPMMAAVRTAHAIVTTAAGTAQPVPLTITGTNRSDFMGAAAVAMQKIRAGSRSASRRSPRRAGQWIVWSKACLLEWSEEAGGLVWGGRPRSAAALAPPARCSS